MCHVTSEQYLIYFQMKIADIVDINDLWHGMSW